MGIFRKKQNDDEVERIYEQIQERRLRIDVLAYAYCVVVNFLARKFALCDILFFDGREPQYSESYFYWNIRPNDYQTAYEFKYEIIKNLLLYNEALIFDKNAQIFVADPIFERKINGTQKYTFKNVSKNDEQIYEYHDSNDSIYLSYPSNEIKNKLIAQMSLLQELIITAGENYELTSYQKGFIKIDTFESGNNQLKEKVDDLINNQFKKLFNVRKNAVFPLYKGMEYIDINKDRSSSKRSEISDIKELISEAVKECCYCFGIMPSAVIGDKENTTEAEKSTIVTAVKPFAIMLEQAINANYITKRNYIKGKRAEVNLGPLTFTTIFDHADASNLIISSSQYSPDELRVARGSRPRYEWWSDRCFGTKNYELIPENETDVKGGEE